VQFKFKSLKRSMYIIISFCLFLSGCSSALSRPKHSEDITANVKTAYSQEIIKDLKEKSTNQQHPRLMATDEDFKRIKRQLKTDENLQRWYKNLQVETKKILRAPTVKYEIPDGLRLLDTSRTVLQRTINLALMYRLTKDKKYADRAWEELSVVADNKKFPNWNPRHFLDTAEMTNAVAIGYDWLYDYLSANQRAILRKALIEKGLTPALQVYRGTARDPEIATSWRDGTDNWNTVSNAGIGMGALAIGDESPELQAMAGEVLQHAIESIKKSLAAYAPDGGMPEGPAYWNYATIYMAYFLSALDSALGTDYGLSKMEGISETGYYPIYTEGAKGTFNVGDAASNIISRKPQMFWFSNKYKNVDFFNAALKGNDPMNLIWYRKPKEKSSSLKGIPLDKLFLNSETGIVTMRSAWNKNATFVGIHAGYNQSNHGDLDIGDFVLDALGVRWTYELGSDDYNLNGYFDLQSKRWMYYRKRAEGQNTLVINPRSELDQNRTAKATITNFSSTRQQSFAIMDMTSAYWDAFSAKRGIALTEERKTVVLQDELKLKKPSEVYWFMHTQAQIELTKDRKTAILTYSGKRIYAHIDSPIAGSFIIMEAKPLPTSPNPIGQASNEGMRKLAIRLSNTQNVTLSVLFKVDYEDEAKGDYWPKSLPLKNWSTSKVLDSR